jgi:hypothetical protein
MNAPSYIAQRIRERALVLYMHGVDREEAKSIAAREIAQEQREQRKHVSNNNHTGSALYRKLSGVLERMFGLNPVQEPPRGTPISGELALPDTPPHVVNRTNEPEAPTPSDIVTGMWTGTGTDASTARWLNDEDFPARFHDDRTTFNWKRSITENQRIETERREAWERRLAERGGRL